MILIISVIFAPMKDLFSPFQPTIFLAVFFSFPFIYLLGSFFTPRLSTPWGNVSARMAMGAIVGTALVAIFHAGLHTMLLPFVFFLPFLWQLKPKGIWSDIKAIPTMQWVVAIGLSLALLVFEMNWADLRVGNNIRVGNWDYANSGGFGYEFYKRGIAETSRFMFQNDQNRGFHHFADAWFAGLYSYYFGVMPYYSYVIVYKVIFHQLFVFLLIGVMSTTTLGARTGLVFSLAVFVFMYAGLQFIPAFSSIGKMESACVEDTLFNCPTFLVLAVSVLLFYIIILNELYFIGLVGLGLVSVWHPSVALIMPIMMIGLIGIKIITSNKRGLVIYIPLTYPQLLFALFFSISPYIYSQIDGRNYAIVSNSLFSYSFMQIVVRQILLTTASLVFFIPFLYGLYGWKKDSLSPFFVCIQLALLCSAILVFSLVYSHLGGDSRQIWAIYLIAFLAPIGSVGLFITAFNKKSFMRYGALFLVGMSIVAIYERYLQVNNNDGIKGFMRFSLGYDDEWKNRSQVSKGEAIKWRQLLSKNDIVDIGIVVSDSCKFKYQESIFMAHLPYLRAYLTGAEFHRLNTIPLDTFSGNGDLPRLTFFKRSNLYNSFQNAQNEKEVVLTMIQKLQPNYLLLDTLYKDYCIPPYLADTYTHFDTLGRFIMVSKESK